jgi:hypothetical protein
VVPSSISAADAEYLAVVDLALREPAVFENFRRMSGYQGIVEHSLAEIRKQDEAILQLYSESAGAFELASTVDYVGNPIKYPGRLMDKPYSPTAAKVFRVLCDLRSFIDPDLNGLRVVEVGAGFGAQMKVFADCFTGNTYLSICDREPTNSARKRRSAAGARGRYGTC